MQGKQNLIPNNSKICYLSDTSKLKWSSNFNLVDMPPTTTGLKKKQSTVLDNAPSVGEGKDKPCHNSTLTNDSISSRIQNIQ